MASNKFLHNAGLENTIQIQKLEVMLDYTSNYGHVLPLAKAFANKVLDPGIEVRYLSQTME
jgi:hypothetical protein